MTDQTKPESLNQLIRDQWKRQRVHWRPSSRSDPAVQRADRDSLNRALRRAAGEDEASTAGTYPWGSLSDDHQRDDGKDGEA